MVILIEEKTYAIKISPYGNFRTIIYKNKSYTNSVKTWCRCIRLKSRHGGGTMQRADQCIIGFGMTGFCGAPADKWCRGTARWRKRGEIGADTACSPSRASFPFVLLAHDRSFVVPWITAKIRPWQRHRTSASPRWHPSFPSTRHPHTKKANSLSFARG